MTETPRPAADLDALLAHRPWVRALAVALTRDAADAEDVEQETWLAALGRAPRDLRTPRAWFVTVARNAARKLARGDARRRRREEESISRPPHPSAAELTAQAEAHRGVVSAVLALDDVHREAVLLRYFEGLGVAEVARRAGVPLETTRARLRRARVKLREQLAAEHGGEDRWRLALAPLVGLVSPARDGAATAAVVRGGALVASKTVIACCVALLLAGAAWWQFGGDGEPGPATGGTSAAPAPLRDDVAPTARPRAASERAAPPAEQAPAVPAPRAADPPRRTAAERLSDPVEPIELMETPVRRALAHIGADVGVRVVLSAEAAKRLDTEEPIVSFAFEKALPGRTLLDLLVRSQGLEAVVEDDRIVVGLAGGRHDPAAEVVAIPAPETPLPTLAVRGSVADPDGVPVSGASVVRIADGKVLAKSDAAGRFEFTTRRPPPTLEARFPGHAPSAPAATGGTEPVALVVGPPGGTLIVRVTAEGKPVADASVQAAVLADVPTTSPDGQTAMSKGARRAATGPDGRATFEGVLPGRVSVVVRRPASVEATAEAVVVRGERCELEVVLVAKPSLREQLEKTPVSFALRDVPVTDVVAFLSRVSGTQVVVMPDAAEIAATTRLSLSAKDLPLSQALRDLCDAAPELDYLVDEENHIVQIRRRAK